MKVNMDDYDAEEMIRMISAITDVLQAYTDDEERELSRTTLYNVLETVRLQTNLLYEILSQPILDRITGTEMQMIVQKAHLTEKQALSLIGQEKKGMGA